MTSTNGKGSGPEAEGARSVEKRLNSTQRNCKEGGVRPKKERIAAVYQKISRLTIK